MRKPTTKPVIVIFTSDEGHLSIAQAMAAALESVSDVRIFFHRGIELDVYAAAYRYLPAAYGAFYQLSQNSSITSLGLRVFSTRKRRNILKFLTETKPDLIICSFLLFLPILSEYRAKTGTPILNIVTDPWTFHPAVMNDQVDLNLGFDDTTVAVAKKLYPLIKSQAVGWFVRPQFAPLKTSQAELRQRLGLENTFTLFVTGGSEGSAMILKLLPALMQPPKAVQVIVACGKNHQFQTLIKIV